jgi:HTH-type transcriptional regulator/antitoxin HigA
MTGPNPGKAHPHDAGPGHLGAPGGWRPDYALPPGHVLRRVLAEHGISQAELATRTGLSPKHVNQVLQGLVPLSPEMALLLERVLDTPSYVWNGLEATYRDSVLRDEAKKKLGQYESWESNFPTAVLVDRRIIEKTDDKTTRVEKILSFFGVADPDAYARWWDQPIAAFRRSTTFAIDPYATATWLRLAEIAAEDIDLAPYDGKAFQRLLPKLRQLTIPPLDRAFSDLRRECANVGVAVVREKQIKGTRVCGATRWINAAYPIVVLSGRYNVEDSLWFSFFHEAGHIILHPKRATYIAPESNDEKDVLEREADTFARATLIPPDFHDQLLDLSTDAEVEEFAHHIGVQAGIVVGRMMNDKLRSWSHGNHLRRKLAT